MNFRLALSFILLVSEFLTSDIFYALDPLGPVASRFATKWNFINEHFVVAAVAWAMIAICVSFFTTPADWQFLRRVAAMRIPFVIAGLIGIAVDLGGTFYQLWTATIDLSVHTWTRWGLILDIFLRAAIWTLLFTGITLAFYFWAAKREADIIDD